MLKIEVPSNDYEKIERLIRSWINTRLCDISVMGICFNSKDTAQISGFKNVIGRIPMPLRKRVGYQCVVLDIEVPTMFYYRALAQQSCSTKENYRYWHLLVDDDCEFKEGSYSWFLNLICAAEAVRKTSMRQPYIQLAGTLGSAPTRGEKLIVSPKCLMSINRGLLMHYSQKFPINPQYREFVGGAEDKLICALAMNWKNALPMKIFKAPIRIKPTPAAIRKENPSLIHNQAIWNNSRGCYNKIREITREWDWGKDFNVKEPWTQKDPRKYKRTLSMIRKHRYSAFDSKTSDLGYETISWRDSAEIQRKTGY